MLGEEAERAQLNAFKQQTSQDIDLTCRARREGKKLWETVV